MLTTPAADEDQKLLLYIPTIILNFTITKLIPYNSRGLSRK